MTAVGTMGQVATPWHRKADRSEAFTSHRESLRDERVEWGGRMGSSLIHRERKVLNVLWETVVTKGS